MPNSADTAVERIREARERQPVAIETLREAVEGLHEKIHNDSLSQEDRDAAKRELRQLRDDALRMKGFGQEKERCTRNWPAGWYN